MTPVATAAGTAGAACRGPSAQPPALPQATPPLARRRMLVGAAGIGAIALMAHWASSADAWDLAYGAKITPGACRVLGDANATPLPITGLRA